MTTQEHNATSPLAGDVAFAVLQLLSEVNLIVVEKRQHVIAPSGRSKDGD
jgi:hypothetical protein